jgi:proprotein convertase subtilisin/kexin type 2
MPIMYRSSPNHCFAPVLTLGKIIGTGICCVWLAACGGSGSGSSTGVDPGLGNGAGKNTGAKQAAIVLDASVAAIGTSLAEDTCLINYTVSRYLGTPATTTDPYLAEQWHLRNTGQFTMANPGEDLNVIPAWSTTMGAGVRVAVVDRGVELTHEDLVANMVPRASYNYFTKGHWPLPCDSSASQEHGTSVAGVILARDTNGLGGSGVAPRASLVSFNPLDATDADIADALTRDNQANHIYNNSWGSNDNGFLHPAQASFEAAINSGLSTGRGGKGSIFVFSAGNGKTVTLPNGATTTETSNFDGYVNKLGIITTCSVDSQGRETYYSEPGANLLVCAPTEVPASATENGRGVRTTALNNTYVSDFDGTSVAAPMVSGVAALMLAANPQLTWRDVRLILAQTARKNDPSDTGWSTSSGYHFNHKYGFGVADANAAVQAAKTWTSVGNSSTLKRCDSGIRLTNHAIPDSPSGVVPGTPLVETITMDNACAISIVEFVEVTITTQHAYPADLQVDLISPTNTNSRLADSRGCDRASLATSANPCAANYTAWRFGSNRHIGEIARGNWQLKLTDMAAQDTGTLASWSISIWGR